MGKSKTSSASDQARAQLGTNVGTAIANANLGMMNQRTPFGSRTYQQTGTFDFTDPTSGKTYQMPRYSVTDTLSAPQQRIFNAQQAGVGNMMTQAMNRTNTPFQFANDGLSAPNLATSYGDPAGYAEQRGRVENALMERRNVGLEQERAALETRLANQGHRVGSESYTRAMADFGRNVNDAQYGAILAAGDEQTRLAGLDAQRASFQNSALQSGFGNRMQLRSSNDQRTMAQRNQLYNEMAALQSGGGIQTPQFQSYSPTQMPGVDVAGLMANENAQAQQQQQQFWGGLMGLGSSFLLSDERAKTDIKKIGKAKDGTGLYAYRYKGDQSGATHVGVMAQEVEKKRPDAVKTGADGFKRVNYGALFGVGEVA